MKKYPKLVQCDSRGQIVIPKEIRRELDIEEGTGFWVYAVTEEGILLKKVDAEELSSHGRIISELEEKGHRIKLKKDSVKKSVENYKKTSKGRLEVI
jgi:AbrB family looped-hinge helix DNA binding protein